MATLRVGGASTTVEEARTSVRRYLNTPAEHWAYPAYDGYPGGSTTSVTEQDLFGPALLNAPLRSLRSYYEFAQTLPELNRRLDLIDSSAVLADLDVDLSAVADVVGLLDDVNIYGVGLTRLSKVVRRKRPTLFPLYDEHIRFCYMEAGDLPVPTVKRRSWRSFADEWLQAVRTDLVDQLDVWMELASYTLHDGPPITELRALDMVGWGLGQPGRQARDLVAPPV